MKNLIYFPWCDSETKRLAQVYKNGQLPFLDIELTAKCSHGTCIYCDSPINQKACELNRKEFFSLMDDALKLGLKWIYFCGLGEPTDCDYFDDILDFVKGNGIKLSFFTNGQNLNKNLIDKLFAADTSILLKFDSLNEKTFDNLLGREGAAHKIYGVLSYLNEIGFNNVRRVGNQTVTNLAFSIVPTTKNYQEIPNMVSYAIKNKIFPSIGELEYANKGKIQYDNLAVSRERLQELKKEIGKIMGESYQRPVCPAAIYSLHLNVNGECVVDKETGLSCPWFKLGDPHYISIGNVRNDSIFHILSNMAKYRSTHIDAIRKMKPHPKTSNTFSGCGGCVSDLRKQCQNSFLPNKTTKKLSRDSIELLLLKGKRVVIFPIDHPIGDDTPRLAKKGIDKILEEVSGGKHDGYILHSRNFPPPKISVNRPFFLTVGEQPDNYLLSLNQLDKYDNINQVAIYFQVRNKNDRSAIDFYKNYVKELKSRGIGVLGMGFPKGKEPCDFFQHIADLAHEIDCDYFKTALSSQTKGLELYGMPLFIGGGEYLNDDRFVDFIQKCKDVPNANVSIGRNVFEDKDPVKRIRLIRQYIRPAK